MTARQFIPITPSVLRWAIRESGYDEADLADEIGVELRHLRDWQEGDSQPSKTQFDLLVAKLKRPTALFFLPREPDSHTPTVKFRRPHGSNRVKANPKELRFLREAARVQATIAWSLRELDSVPDPLPLIAPSTSVETAAKKIRDFLVTGHQSESVYSTDSQMQRAWRDRIESKGTLVFLLPLGRDSVRGFSLYDEVAPLLAVNTHWDYRPRVFSMLHELSHLVSRTSSACVESFDHRLPEEDDQIERWCEGVASAVLLPSEQLGEFLRTALPLTSTGRVNTLEQLYKVANHFRTSARATAIRLINKGLATWNLYRQIPKSKEEKHGGGGGGGRTRPEIREDEYGKRALSVFARAVDEGLLTGADASGFLKISDIDLDAVR
jgi:Zn-dependent peptidase ImmA (M78 family)